MLKALEIRGLSTGSHSCKIILNFIKQKEKNLKKKNGESAYCKK